MSSEEDDDAYDAYANVAGGALRLKGSSLRTVRKGASKKLKKKLKKKAKKKAKKARKKEHKRSRGSGEEDGEGLGSSRQQSGPIGPGGDDEGDVAADSASFKKPKLKPYEEGMTPAQLKFERIRRQREVIRLKELAAKPHRERVQEYNEHLASLSEIHDIPKVGPG